MVWSSLLSARWYYVQPSPDPGSHRVPRGGGAGHSREAQPWFSLGIAHGWWQGQWQQELGSQLTVSHTGTQVCIRGWQGNVHFSSEAVLQNIKGINCYSLMQFCSWLFLRCAHWYPKLSFQIFWLYKEGLQVQFLYKYSILKNKPLAFLRIP